MPGTLPGTWGTVVPALIELNEGGKITPLQEKKKKKIIDCYERNKEATQMEIKKRERELL